jgi:hypothetical protein
MTCNERKVYKHLENARKELEASRVILKYIYLNEGRMLKETVYELLNGSWKLNEEYAEWEKYLGELQKSSAVEKIKLQVE